MAIFAGVQKWRGGELAVLRFLAVGCVMGAVLIVLLVTEAGVGIEALAGIFVYAFLCELYIFLFTLVRTSVSARILLTLRYGPTTLEGVVHKPAGEGPVETRIARLIAAGLAAHEGEVAVATPKGERLLRVFAALNRFFGHAERNGT